MAVNSLNMCNMRKESGVERIHEEPSSNRKVVEAIVDDWIEKYPLREGNLAIINPDDPKQIQRWIDGVLGRIKHQMIDSGFPMKKEEMELAIISSLHKNLADDEWYFPYLLRHLPSAQRKEN